MLSINTMLSTRKKYSAHKGSAKQRGIPFLLTFEQWWQIWQESGHWEERGRYQMTRPKDEGPYAVGNVKIATGAQNWEESRATRARRKAARAASINRCNP
jgi:hypothetical protein